MGLSGEACLGRIVQGLIYKVERKGRSLVVRIQIQGSRRILYLDTLKAAAQKSDIEAIAFLSKIHLKTTRNPETLPFERIEVPPQMAEEALRLMKKTGRMTGELDVPFESPLSVLPVLVLNETSGSFARLWMDYGIGEIEYCDFAPLIQGRNRLKQEEAGFEKDLLEAGYQKRGGPYFCPVTQVKEALMLLMDIGWRVIDPLGKPLSKQITVTEERGRIAVSAQARALIDPKLQMDGIWEGEVLYLPRARVGSVFEVLGGADWDERLLKCAQGLKMAKTALPGIGFNGTLLPYQQKGVDWLWFLYEWGFSGLLADEMGLGKTVQVLAFLSRIGTNLPVLIVTPTSLLFNWRLEIEKFLPSRKVELISYAALRLNDFSQKEFEIIVLDESNAIKNAATQTAKAAFQLKGKCKICISGTPMENRSDELWAQFHFLMPGLIERNSQNLKSQVRPFLLRRKKEEVQLELPEKIEQIAWIAMEEEHEALYNEARRGLKPEGNMQILEAILQLRQIANEAKIEQILLDLAEAQSEKRKILVFSQFTAMLKRIHKEFPQALYLDGSTNSTRRGELVQQFQSNPDCCLFFLSLKAGGVGLNLTAADYVFLVDPWWNEAVERQAIDRAHRIGRKNTVIAKRYLTLGTVEEKMIKLKSDKLKAIDQLLDFDGGNLTEDDLAFLLS